MKYEASYVSHAIIWNSDIIEFPIISYIHFNWKLCWYVSTKKINYIESIKPELQLHNVWVMLKAFSEKEEASSSQPYSSHARLGFYDFKPSESDTRSTKVKGTFFHFYKALSKDYHKG